MKLRPLLVCTAMLAAALRADAAEVLVTTDWVFAHLADPKVRILEVSVDPGVYEKGHVQGAVGVRWHDELADPIRRDVVSRANFEKLAARAGVTRDSTVVLYGDNNNWFAAWGYWIFKSYGHADVRLMDGGRKKWEAERRPWDTTTPAPKATSYAVARTEQGLRARLADVLDVVEKRKPGVLVDVRSPDEFAGKVFAPQGIQELAIRAGHVPGAKSIPWSRAVNEDGTFKSKAELQKLYADAGVDGKTPVVTYCRIGERSSHSWFVLKELLGFDVRNYDGSWTEYGNAVGVPIENPSGTVWTGK
jgi:thiosulfate/3-mercaptopyruvate sulfurtransferase